VTASAQGIDVSQFQDVLTPALLSGVDFVFIKATEGLTITDANLDGNWQAARAWGGVTGFYHEFVPQDDSAGQAQYFYAAVQAAGGLSPGDMAAVVASDYTGTTGAEIAAWCTEITALAGRHVIPVVYSDLSVLPSLQASTQYPLWVAWPAATAPTAAQVAPWSTWTFWQYGESGTDEDAFNGTAADLAAWIAAASGRTLEMIIVWGVTNAYLLSGGKLHHILDAADLDVYLSAGVPQTTSHLSAAEEAALLADFPPGNPAVTVNATLPPVTLPDLTVSLTGTGTVTPATT
jgi:GH25 family lysozyme M1 (1,4-beta-N-acetylmuramidase)